MKIYLSQKIVFLLRGNAQKLLSGLTSNALDAPRNAFVNQHGRIIATFDQIKISGDDFLIVFEAFAIEGLLNHIQKFLMLNKTTAEKMDFQVYFDLDGMYTAAQGEYAIAQRAGQLVITANELSANISDEDFTRFRLQNNIPLFGIDYSKDEFLLNVDEHEFVSYTKGCFLGQEPIAKVHNRSKPTRKLVVAYEDELAEESRIKMTSKIRDLKTGKVLGFVSVKNDEVL